MKWYENHFAICFAPVYQEKPSSGRGAIPAFPLTCIHELIVRSALSRRQRPNDNTKIQCPANSVGTGGGKLETKETNSPRMPTLFLSLERKYHNIQRFLQKFMRQSNIFSLLISPIFKITWIHQIDNNSDNSKENEHWLFYHKFIATINSDIRTSCYVCH